MGVAASSADLSDATLKRTLHADQQLLTHYLTDPSALGGDAAVTAAVYREVVSGVGTQGSTTATALTSWLPPLAHEKRYVKAARLRNKTADTAAVLQLLPEHDAARARLLKFLQRQSHFLVARADPHAHLLHARAALLQRGQLAFERWSRREDLSAILGPGGVNEDGTPVPAAGRVDPPAAESAEDKTKFLEMLFARSLEEELPKDGMKYSSFYSPDEFVAQLFSLMEENLPSAPPVEEELAAMEAAEKREALAAVAASEAASAGGVASASSPLSLTGSDSASSIKAPRVPVRLFGVTGLMGLPLFAPSTIAASKEEAAVAASSEPEPRPNPEEDDASYAARLNAWMEARQSRAAEAQQRRFKQDQLALLKRKKQQERERAAKAAESEEKQAKLRRQDSAALALAEAAAADLGLLDGSAPSSSSATVDPDASLKPEARFSSMQLLEMVLDESVRTTEEMLAKAAEEFARFKSKTKKAEAAAAGGDATKEEATAGVEQTESENDTPSIYPLNPLPVTHLLHWLLRDLLRKASLCTTRGQTPLRQMHYALKRVMQASERLLAAAKPLVSLGAEQEWAAFEKQLQYESAEAGSVHTLFASCATNPNVATVPNAPPQGPASSPAQAAARAAAAAAAAASSPSSREAALAAREAALAARESALAAAAAGVRAAASSSSAASSSGSSSSPSSSQGSHPVSTAASPSAPLVSTLLSTSLLSQVALPTLGFVWSTLFKPLLFEGINEKQDIPRGTTEYPADEEEQEEESKASESDEKKQADVGAGTATPSFNLFEVLLSFLRSLDSFNASLPSTAGEEALHSLVSSSSLSDPSGNPLGGGVVVETPHTYFSDLDDTQVVHIPNASYLVVEFDPRCSSERNRDHLSISVPQEDPAAQMGLALPQPPLKVAGPFHGPRDQWPKMPIIVQNTSTLVFNWHAEAAAQASTYFGFRALVTGYTHTHELLPPAANTSGSQDVEFVNKTVQSTIQGPLNGRGGNAGLVPKATLSHSRPWYFLFDLQQTLAHVVGRALRKEIIGLAASASDGSNGSNVDEEAVLSKYLNSPLFFREDASEDNASEEVDTAEDDEEDHPRPQGSPPPTEAERAARASDAAVEAKFLRELIDAKAGSAGAQLDTLLRKQLQSKKVDMLGGAVTKRAVRLFVAVLLKHLGLARLAAYWLLHKGVAVEGISLPEAPTAPVTLSGDKPAPASISSVLAQVGTDVPPTSQPVAGSTVAAPQSEQDWAALGEALLEVWRKGQNMHQVIVSGKQLAQQALDNLIEQQKVAESVAAAAAGASTPAAGSGAAASSSAAPAAASSSSPAPASAAPVAAVSAATQRIAELKRLQAEHLATYEGYTSQLVSKCEYLLARPSFSAHPLTEGSAHVTASQSLADLSAVSSLDLSAEKLSLVQAVRSSSEQGAPQPVQTLKLLLSMQHTTHHLHASKEELRRQAARHSQSLADLISTFVRDEVPLRTVKRIRLQQVSRAQRRAAALDTLLSLLRFLSLRSSHVSLLATFGPPFRAYTMYGLGPEDELPPSMQGGHVLQHIEASGRKHRMRVQDAFNALYSYFIEQLRPEHAANVPLAVRALILDALCIDWHANARENAWLQHQQLLPILDQIANAVVLTAVGGTAASAEQLLSIPGASEPTPMQQLAANLLRFLSINSMNPQIRSGALAAAGRKGAKKNAAKSDEAEEKAVVPVAAPRRSPGVDDGDDEKKSDAAPLSPSPPPASTATAEAPFAFLTTPDSLNPAPLDGLQRQVLDRMLASLQHSASLLPALRRQGGESVQDSEIVDISLTPEQKLALYRKRVRPSLTSAVSSTSASERAAALAGLMPDEEALLGLGLDGQGDDEISFEDAHPSFPLIRRYIELEQSAFDALGMLASVASEQHHRSFLEYLCTAPVLRTLLLVFVSGSPRMQTLSIRMLGKVLPFVSALQLREHALVDYLHTSDKNERFGARRDGTASVPAVTPSSSSATSTPFSQALRQSYEAPSAMDTFSLGEAPPQVSSLALSRSSSLQARQETDALLASELDESEAKLDALECSKFVTFLFRRLAELQLATTEQQEGGVAVPRPNTPLAASSSLSPSSSLSSLVAAHKPPPKSVNPLACQDGAMKLTLASELVSLIRTLHQQSEPSSSVAVPVASAPAMDSARNTDWSTAIHAFIGTHLLSLAKLVASDEPRIASASHKNEVGMSLACLSVIGGHSEVLRVGGMVAATQRGAESEQGILVAVDRVSNRAKVLFRHTPHRVIECDLSRVRAVDAVAPSEGLVTLNHALLQVFQVFTRALQQEEQERLQAEQEAAEKKKKLEEEKALRALQKQFDDEEAKLLDPFGGFQDELQAFWACPACTFESPITKPKCEICGQENPNFFIKKATVEEDVDADDEEALADKAEARRTQLTNEHLLYAQLRSKALKALCVLLGQTRSQKLLFESGSHTGGGRLLPSLVSMAVRPTSLDVFKSIEQLEAAENRLVELLAESAQGLVQDHLRFTRSRAQDATLKYSPFRQMQIHLPSALDVASARGVSFVGDRDGLCEVKYSGSSAGGGLLSVGLVRANFLVPSSLPAYYFEMTVHSMGNPSAFGSAAAPPRSGSSSPSLTPQLVRKNSPVLRALASPSRGSPLGTPNIGPNAGGASGGSTGSSGVSSSDFDVAIGLFRCGMPHEGWPGKHSTYAYSGRAGELHFTRNKAVTRAKMFERFKAGDTVGCGVHLRHGQRTIFFTKNGKLLHARTEEDELEALELGPTAVGTPSRSTPRSSAMTSISGVDANLSGRFYPAAWMQHAGAHLSFNYGQSPFLFDFATETLPADYRAQLAAQSQASAKPGPKLTPAELKRRTMAEDLLEMMGGNFPLEICVLALERCNDDKAAAGDWLFTHGTREVENMAQQALRSQAEAKRNGGANAAGDDGDSSDEEEDLSDYLLGGDASNQAAASRQRDSAQSMLDDEVDTDIPLGLDLAPRQQVQQQQIRGAPGAGGGRGSELERQRERARALLQMRGRGDMGDEELQQLLASVLGQERGGAAGSGAGGDDDSFSSQSEQIIYENLRLDEIESGTRLVVSPSAVRLTAGQQPWMAYFAGRTGVVTAVNINAALVTLIFSDPQSGIRRCASFPVTVLQQPQRMWLDPARDLYERQSSKAEGDGADAAAAAADKNVPWQELAHELASIEKALSVIKVRRAVLRVIAAWPRHVPFDAAQLNGPDGVMAILKLTAAQFLSSSYKRSQASAGAAGAAESDPEGASQANLLDAFRTRIVQLVASENEHLLRAAKPGSKSTAIAPPLRITEKLYATATAGDSKSESAAASSSAGGKSIQSASFSASAASGSSALLHGYSSASANESEDDASSLASSVGARPRGGRAAVLRRPVLAEEHGDEDEDAEAEDEEEEEEEDEEHDEDDGEGEDEEHEHDYGEEEEDGGQMFDEGEEEYDDDGGMQDLHALIREGVAVRIPDMQGGMGVPRAFLGQAAQQAMQGQGFGRGAWLRGASVVPPQPVRRSRPKKKIDEATKQQYASLDEKLQQQLRQPRSSMAAASSSSAAGPALDSLVTPLLVEECITHFVQSVNHGPPVKTVSSAHPYPSNSDKRGRVHIGGAAKLLIRFDPRCAIGTDLMTRLSFYRDRHYQDLIATVQGSGAGPDHVFPPLIVDSDRFYYRFTSGANSRLWGFRIRVEPIDQRIDDKSALLGRNAELSGWLLDLFLASFPALAQYAYSTELYNAVVWYVCHIRPSRKASGIDLLVRLLFHLRSLIRKDPAAEGKAVVPAAAGAAEPTAAKAGSALGKLAELKAASASASISSSSAAAASSSSASVVPARADLGFVPTLSAMPDFSKLKPLAQEMDSVLEAMGLSGSAPPLQAGPYGRQQANFQRSLQTPTMMSCVELLSTVDLLNNEFEQYAARLAEDAAAAGAGRKAQHKEQTVPLPSTTPTENGAVDLVADLHDRLRIDKALLLYHVPPAEKAAAASASAAASSDKAAAAPAQRAHKDITSELSRYLAQSHHLQLWLPTDPALLKEIPGFENEVSASTLAAASAAGSSASASAASSSSGGSGKKAGFSKLSLTLSILTPTWNAATQQLECRVSKTFHRTVHLLATCRPTLIKPVPSRFDNVVAMSRLTLEMKQSAAAGSVARLPPEFLLEAHRNYLAQRHFVQLVGERPFDSVPNKAALSRPSPSAGLHNGTRSYTLSFWVYLSQPGIPPAKEAHFRFVAHAGNLPEQSSTNLAHGIRWPQAGFSLGLGAKDNNIHVAMYENSGTAPIRLHSRSPLTAKRWTHVTLLVADGLDVTLYIDGSCEISHKSPVPLPALTGDPLFVGALPGGLLRLYNNQKPRAAGAPEPAPQPDDAYRQGLGFSGSLKDMRLYSYDVDPAVFVPLFQQRAAKLTQERSNKAGFQVAVDKATLLNRRELLELMSAGTGKVGAVASSSVAAASVASTSAASVHWTPAMDIQVMELFQSVTAAVRNRRPQEQPQDEEDDDGPRPQRESHVHMLDLPVASKAVVQVLEADPKLRRSANLLSHLDLEVLKQRFAAIQLLNGKLIDVLPFVDFAQARNPWSLAHRLSSISWLILLEVKNRAWRSVLQATAHGHTVNITINRPRALKARESGRDPEGHKSVFGQVWQQLHFLRPAQLRIQQGNRPFRVKFAGEGGIDAGGLFRDAVSEVCTSLVEATPLFVACPNASTFGDNSNTFVPNPSCTTTTHCSEFAFVGKFMACAIRGGHVLNLDFPPLLWKLLVGTPLTRADIADINTLALRILEQYADPALDEAAFAELPVQRFVTLSSDGREVELKPGGAAIPVTYATRLEYARLEEHYRLHEFDLAVQHMRKGLGAVVPVHLLSLFTAAELEAMVCGAREVDVELLKRNTEYQRLRPSDPHVQWLWQVLEEMSQRERQMFVRFVSGQSRLWSDEKDFVMKFKLMPSQVDNDQILPVSHTCFFSLELPRYSSLAVMRAKLQYSIANCTAIDADTVADNLDWNADD